MPCGWGVKAGMVRAWVAYILRDPLVTQGPYLNALEIKRLYIKRDINSYVYLLTYLLKT